MPNVPALHDLDCWESRDLQPACFVAMLRQFKLVALFAKFWLLVAFELPARTATHSAPEMDGVAFWQFNERVSRGDAAIHRFGRDRLTRLIDK
jgi:hypothetical protein